MSIVLVSITKSSVLTAKLFDDASWEDSIKAYKEFQSKCKDNTNIYYKKAEKELIELKSTSTIPNRENIAPDLDPCRKSEYLNAEGDNYYNRDKSLRKFIENCNDSKNKYYLKALKKIDELEIKVNSNIRKPLKEKKKDRK